MTILTMMLRGSNHYCYPHVYPGASGAVAVLKPNEDAFEKQMEGLPSTTRSVGELPPELKCPLC
ncbi:hypothetical protein Bca4012_035541 [Brassica carinata]